MIKLSFCLRRKPHLTREEFQTYWRDKHPLCVPKTTAEILGIKRYVQVHTIDTDARELVDGPREGLEEQYDGIAELWLESIDALRQNYSSPEAKSIIQKFIEDEENFVDWTRSTSHVSKEIVMIS